MLTLHPGQVFWASILSPPKYARFLSYVDGAFTTMLWCTIQAAQSVLTAQTTTALATVCTKGVFTATNWQNFLVSLALLFFGMSTNLWALNVFAKSMKFMTVLINGGALFLFVTLLVRTSPKQSAHQVFVEVVNETGWDSLGLVFLLGLLPGSTCISAFDTVTHLTEEVPQPERNIPKVMIITALMCGFGGLVMVITLLFCTVNPVGLLTPLGGQAIAQLTHDAFRSYSLTVIMMLIYVIVYLFGCPAVAAAGSRVIWSFAKHGGLPFSRQLAVVDSESQIPGNAVVTVTLVGVIISVLQFGPTYVLNAVFGCGAICTFGSLAIPIWLLIIRGRHILPEKRFVNLGSFGLFINVVAAAWQIVQVLFLSFPLFRPVTALSMNYAAPVFFVGVLIFALNWVFYSRHHYVAPKPLSSAATSIDGLHDPQNI